MKIHKSYRLFFLVAALLFLVSCNDDNNSPGKNDSQMMISVEQSVKAQNAINEVIQQVNAMAFQSVPFVKNITESGCPDINIFYTEETQKIDSIVLDYGIEGCMGTDQKFYKGKIILVFNVASPEEVNFDILFNDFCTEEFCLDGEFSYDFGEEVNNGNFSIQIQNGVFESEEGTYMLSVDFDYEQIEGGDTEDLDDDVYSISGYSSGTTPEGEDFTMVITSPLRFAFDCEYITEGEAQYTFEEMPQVTIDFGDGSCDNKAMVTIEEVEQEIEM